MPANAMFVPFAFWLSILSLVILVVSNRLLPKSRFKRLAKAISAISFAVGAVFVAAFIPFSDGFLICRRGILSRLVACPGNISG